MACSGTAPRVLVGFSLRAPLRFARILLAFARPHWCRGVGGSTLGFFASRGRVKLQAARAVQGLPDDSDSGTTQEKASPCIVTIEEGGRAEKKRAQQR